MPFYEYECKACKFYTEVMQKITDAPLVKCPSCGKRQLKKLLSAPVFRLKGGGWYETDFKSDKENKRNLSGADKEEVKAETKAETKDAKTGAEISLKEKGGGEAPAATGKAAADAKPPAVPAEPRGRSRARVSRPPKSTAARKRASGARRKGARKVRR